MKPVYSLAKLFLQAQLRKQVHLITLFVAVMLLMLPAYVNAFSLGLGAFERVAKDFGLTLISFYGVGMALLLGSTVLDRELQSRSLYPLLARPLSRRQYLAAHLLALLVLLVCSILLLGLVLFTSIGVLAGYPDFGIFKVVSSSALECSVLLSACLFFSTFASPALAGVMGAFTYIAGGLSNAFISFFLMEDRQSALSAALAKTFKAFLPNFQVFRIKDPVVHQIEMPPGYLLVTTSYGLAYVVLFLLLADLVFRRKDL